MCLCVNITNNPFKQSAIIYFNFQFSICNFLTIIRKRKKELVTVVARFLASLSNSGRKHRVLPQNHRFRHWLLFFLFPVCRCTNRGYLSDILLSIPFIKYKIIHENYEFSSVVHSDYKLVQKRNTYLRRLSLASSYYCYCYCSHLLFQGFNFNRCGFGNYC